MKTFIALLRGINVGGQKKIKMVDLRLVLEDAGLKNVKTYIQSGNIVFDGGPNPKEVLKEKIRLAIHGHYGFDVPVLVKGVEQLEKILIGNPFVGKQEDNRLYYVLLKQPPEKELVEKFNQISFVNEEFYISDDCVYLCCKKGYGNAKLNNNLIEKKLKVQATTRNLRTLEKLIDMANT